MRVRVRVRVCIRDRVRVGVRDMIVVRVVFRVLRDVDLTNPVRVRVMVRVTKS